MKGLYFFGYYLNGLEFVTFIIIPSSIVLIILVYLYFNIDLLKFSINEPAGTEKDILDKIEYFESNDKTTVTINYDQNLDIDDN